MGIDRSGGTSNIVLASPAGKGKGTPPAKEARPMKHFFQELLIAVAASAVAELVHNMMYTL